MRLLVNSGEFTGMQLEFYPASMISWQEFKAQHPNGKVLSRYTGHERNYGKNPYVGYGNINQTPFLYNGITREEPPPMARVMTVNINNEAVAFPYEILREVKVINDTVGGEDVIVFWRGGTASALDSSSISDG